MRSTDSNSDKRTEADGGAARDELRAYSVLADPQKV
jgi:hypothetical protein